MVWGVHADPDGWIRRWQLLPRREGGGRLGALQGPGRLGHGRVVCRDTGGPGDAGAHNRGGGASRRGRRVRTNSRGGRTVSSTEGLSIGRDCTARGGGTRGNAERFAFWGSGGPRVVAAGRVDVVHGKMGRRWPGRFECGRRAIRWQFLWVHHHNRAIRALRVAMMPALGLSAARMRMEG